ncbi:MAG: malto-oligosyltrehalose synthase [Rhodospirillales bacterium]
MSEEPPQPASLAVPRATYRLQFSREFTIADGTALVPYLRDLGISHVYASPFLAARSGSTHGYDITDHNALNPELGTDAQFAAFFAALRAHGLGLILDFVPNHMGIGRADNAWWLDVLKWGQASPYADFFDIDWMPRARVLWGKVLAPILGDHYGHVLERGELELRYDPDDGSYAVWYHEHRLPIRPRTQAVILRRALAAAELPEAAGIAAIADGFDLLRRPSARQRDDWRRRDEVLRGSLVDAARTSPSVARFLDRAAASFNGAPGEPGSFAALHALLERQHYRLAFWRVAADEINYRRFFNINDLAGIRMEHRRLFDITHGLVGRLIESGDLHGLRLDHVDGLYDPAAYCRRLQEFARARRPAGADGDFYIVVEKILAAHENLRADWPIAGTTGYEFVNLVNGLFVDPAGERGMDRAWRQFAGPMPPFDDEVAEAKAFVIENMLASELNILANEIDRISERDWSTRDYTGERLRAALREVVAQFPVYRTYVSDAGDTAEDRRDIDWAISRARRGWRAADVEVFDFIRAILTATFPGPRAAVLRAAMKFQQYTGPVMAKSLEDTVFYRHNRLLSLNEVGGEPRQFGVASAAFHQANRQRARQWPHAMLATATHDTKRGEDARARLDVLSEIPQAWSARVARWHRLNRRLVRAADDGQAPTRNDAYMIYQTLVASWPVALTGRRPQSADELGNLAPRLAGFVVKAVREAKQHSSWDNPYPAYEDACTAFVQRLLEVERPNPFLDDFVGFAETVAFHGMLNGLCQAILKCTAPGVPDIYRGCELWDLSLVDPDNRRPVDFGRRRRMLAALPAAPDPASVRAMLDSWIDGRIKLHATTAALRLRAALPALFRDGGYEPLEAVGRRTHNVVAFARRHDGAEIVVATARLFVDLLGASALSYAPGERWHDTAVVMPGDDARPWHDALTGTQVTPVPHEGGVALPAETLFAVLPAAILTRDGVGDGDRASS